MSNSFVLSPPPRRKVRFVDSTPSPSISSTDRLAGFDAPEVVQQDEISVSRISSATSMSMHGHEDGEEEVSQLPPTAPASAITSTSHTQTQSSAKTSSKNESTIITHQQQSQQLQQQQPQRSQSADLFSTPTVASLAAAAGSAKTKSVSHADDDAMESSVINSAPQADQSRLLMPPSGTALSSLRHNHTYSYSRTPSPNIFSAATTAATVTPNPIVSFSSRVKGSSVLFAPPGRHGRNSSSSSSSSITNGPNLISPIDYNHHVVHNNAGYQPRVGTPTTPSSFTTSHPPVIFSLPPPSIAPTRLRSQSTSSSSTPTTLPPMSSLPATLPSRDLSSLRHGDVGVGHDTREHFEFDDIDAPEHYIDHRHHDQFDRDERTPIEHDPTRFSITVHPNPTTDATMHGTGAIARADLDADNDVDAELEREPSTSDLQFPHDFTRSPSQTLTSSSVNQLPLYTRILRIFLIGIGVVRYSSVASSKSSISHADFPLSSTSMSQSSRHLTSSTGSTAGTSATTLRSPAHRVRARDPNSFKSVMSAKLKTWWIAIRSYVYPLIVFLFITANIFFVSVSKNSMTTTSGRSYNNWIHLISDFCINTAPLLSWLGAFFMVGWDDQRAFLVFFEQLSNLETYNYRVLRNYLVGSCVAGLVLMATTNLTSSGAEHGADSGKRTSAA